MENRRGEDGVAVLLSFFYTLLVLGLVLTGISGHRVAKRSTTAHPEYGTELQQLAEAGLMLALHDLRKGDSLEQEAEGSWSLSYGMGGKLWGSVEVSLEDHGRVLSAIAKIHERTDAQRALDRYPNYLLARAKARVRLGRIRFRPPAKAPLVLGSPGKLDLESDLLLQTRSGEAMLAYVAGRGKLPALPEGSLAMPLPAERLELSRLLGIRREDLARMADRHVPVGEPFPEMDWGLAHLRGDWRLDAENPLEGNGFVVVEGDLTLSGDVEHEFEGILLVTGTLTIRGHARVEGMTIVMGGLRVLGEDSALDLQFDGESLRRALWSVEGIRFLDRPRIFVESVTQRQSAEASR